MRLFGVLYAVSLLGIAPKLWKFKDMIDEELNYVYTLDHEYLHTYIWEEIILVVISSTFILVTIICRIKLSDICIVI